MDPTNDTSLTILTNYQDDPKGGLFNFVPSVGSVLHNPYGKIPTSFYAGDPNLNLINRSQYALGYLFEHRFDDTWSVRQNLRYQNTRGNLNQVLPLGLASDAVTLDRFSQATHETLDAFTVDTQLEARFATGALGHKVLAGIDYQHTHFEQQLAQDFAPSINIFFPVYYQPIPMPSLFVTHQDQTQQQLGFYAQDQIRWDKLFVLGGLRYDDFDSDTTDVLSPLTTTQKDHSTTGRVGVLYLFDSGIAPYATYATSFQPVVGAEFSARPFVPTTGTLYEAGIKYQPIGYDSRITLSAYQLTQQNALTADPDPSHIGFLVQTGEVRSRGFELEGKLSLSRELNVVGSYTYIDAEVTKSNDVDLGKAPLGIPRNMASLWGNYIIGDGTLNGLGFGLGVRYIGQSYGDAANTLTVPSFTLVDAALSYELGSLGPRLRCLRLAVNATNLLNKEYVSECTNANCLYGLRQSILATLRYQF